MLSGFLTSAATKEASGTARAAALVLFVYALLSIFSLVACSSIYSAYHLGWSGRPSLSAIAVTAPLLLAVVPLFALVRFSFGYIVGCWLFSAVVGFVWISFFSVFDYPHLLARCSMIVSLGATLAPLLFLDLRLPRPTISERAWHRSMIALLLVALLILLADASYGVALANPFTGTRNTIARPAALNYLTAIMTGSLLPYLFAWFTSRGRYLIAALTLVVALAYYPTVVNKTVLLLPVWLLFLTWLFVCFDGRLAAVLSLITPLTIGLFYFSTYRLIEPARTYYPLFSIVNLRFIAMPSIAIDHYANFFAHHALTHFCQVSVIRKFLSCPYGELGPVMANVYHDGNFNASFLATEGLASVGPVLAPLSALGCGLILAVGSATARHLSPRFVGVSSGIAVIYLLNVPLTVALLSDGVGMLFLLWWLTPSQLSDHWSSYATGG